MLNISTTSAVSWPTPVSTAVVPVSPVSAVPFVQTGREDGKTEMGFGRDGRTAQQQAEGRVAVPGRTPAGEGAAPATGDTSSPAAQDVAARRQARQEATEAAEQKQTRDKTAVEHLQKVLSRMWEVSGAVVDRALGLEPPNGRELPGNQSDTAPDLSAVAASTIPRKPPVPEREARPAPEPLPWPVMPAPDGVEVDLVGDGVAADGSAAELVAYDEHGNGSAAPVEAGSLISERV